MNDKITSEQEKNIIIFFTSFVLALVDRCVHCCLKVHLKDFEI
jgi:hypothetical protein